MENGKVRLVLFEMTGSDQSLQEAMRTFAASVGSPQAAPAAVVEIPAPVSNGHARLAAPKVAIDCLPVKRKAKQNGEERKGMPSPVQDLCLAVLKLRPMTSTGVQNAAEKKSGKAVSLGSVYSALEGLKRKGLAEPRVGDAAGGMQTWHLTGETA